MKFRFGCGRFPSLFLILISMHAGARLAKATSSMVAIDFNSNFWNVNKATGVGSDARPTGVSNPIDIATSPDGQIFTANADGGGSANLYTINSTTGTASLVGSTGLANLIEGGLAFNSSGQLYGAYEIIGSNEEALLTFNTTTGMATVVGAMPASIDVSALAFSSSGTLYGIDSGVNTNQSALFTIDHSTGNILTTTNLSLNLGSALVGAAIDPDTGIFYVASNNDLYTLSTSSGVLTLVGAMGITDISGIAFTPEPGTFALIAMATAICGRRRSTPLRG